MTSTESLSAPAARPEAPAARPSAFPASVDALPTVQRGRWGLLPVSLVLAVTPTGGIGKDGALPWRLRDDLAFFRRVTSASKRPAGKNAVIMGRKTWQSIPADKRPLAGRLNVVLSTSDEATVRREDGISESVLVLPSLQDAVQTLSAPAMREREHLEEIFVVGGSAAFAEAFETGLCDRVLATELLDASRFADCNVTVPWPPAATRFRRIYEGPEGEEDGLRHRLCVYTHIDAVLADAAADTATAAKPLAAGGAGGGAGASSSSSTSVSSSSASSSSSAAGLSEGGTTAVESKEGEVVRSSRPTLSAALSGRHEELQYLDLVRDILESGVQRGDRTGTGTLSKFGAQLRFSLRDDVFPLLTTKRVFWRGVAEELIWFIAGSTNAKLLAEKGVHIWDGNGSKEFLEKRGLGHREEGDLGPVYGFQWRHFGAEYTDMHADYTGQGVDQLAEVIHTIKMNPTDRRIVLTAWNPVALPAMALPPCHMFCQFYVADGELSCQMYQRSADMGLGVPFNIASYALLTRLLAQVCDLKAGDFVHVIGDAHVYLNHVEPLREQLSREPRPFPRLRIDPSVKEIDAFRFEHFTVEGYDPHKPIKMDMAV